jgi:hypothetical protein
VPLLFISIYVLHIQLVSVATGSVTYYYLMMIRGGWIKTWLLINSLH